MVTVIGFMIKPTEHIVFLLTALAEPRLAPMGILSEVWGGGSLFSIPSHAPHDCVHTPPTKGFLSV